MTSSPTEHDTEVVAAIQESAHGMLRSLSPLSRLRKLRGTEPGFDRAVWFKLAEAGWTGIFIDEAFGGMDLGLRAACAIAAEVGKHPLPEPYLSGSWHASLLLRALPSTSLRDELLTKLAGGDLVIGVAWQAGENVTPLTINASGDMLTISGVRHWVFPAHADGWLLAGEDTPLLWVPGSANNVRAQAHPRVDGSLACTLHLDNAVVSQANVLAEPKPARHALRQANNLLRVAQAAELQGIAQASFDATLNYLKTRTQFGKPIGANQALQHRMVDAYLQLRLAQATLAQFLNTYGDEDSAVNPDELEGQCARVKARCAHAAQHITRLAIQFHGAIGYTDELDIGLYLKRMLNLITWNGGIRENRRLAAQHVQHTESGTCTQYSNEHYGPETDWNALPEQEFRAVVRDFTAKNYPSRYRHPTERLHWHEIKDWYMALSHRGWIAPAWPKEHGGMGLSPTKLIAFIEEMEAYGVARTPDQGIINIGPVLMRYGNPEQRAKFLPKILSGEHVWCQGYSEPNAGSDLASLRTEAIDHGDHFIVNGQKIWTTLAQDATHIFLLVRTDRTVKKQAGISFLLADMSSPGITVRPIRNIGGEEEFCEVFFDNVRVPKENLVGELNQGWTIAKALLDFERLFVGSPSQARYALNQLRGIGTQRELFNDTAFCDTYNDALLDVMDLEALYGEYVDIVKRGDSLPPSVSLLKIWATETYSRLCMLSVEAAGESGGDDVLVEMAGVHFTPVRRLYNASITTIYGGTNEIQRNILAKVVLEMSS